MKTTKKIKKTASTDPLYRVELFWCDDWVKMLITLNYDDAIVYANDLIKDYGIKLVRLMQEVHIYNELVISDSYVVQSPCHSR